MLRISLLSASVLIFAVSAVADSFTTDFGDGGTINVESIKRTSDDTVTVRGSVKNTGTGSLTFRPVLDSDYFFQVALQDLKGKKEYKRVEAGNRPVASRHISKYELGAGEEVKFWARVTAPPKEVGSASVVFGADAAPIDNVPITE